MLVDLVATYKVSPEMKKRTQELRLKLEQEAVKKVRRCCCCFCWSLNKTCCYIGAAVVLP